MTERESLLAAVAATPAADLPRLVFADWLDERGGRAECIWAKFIRGQIQRPVSPVRNAPLTVLTQLEPFVGPYPHKFTRNWGGVAGATVTYPNGMEFWFRRGFVEEVHMPLECFLQHAKPLFRACPAITAVVLTDREPHESVFSNQPESCRWMWIWNDRTFRAAGATLPDGLYHKLRIKSFRDGGHDWAGYPSPVAAHAALSAAAVSLGRELANLPPLEAVK